MSGVLITSFFLIIIIIGISVMVTVKAYSITNSETIDQIDVSLNSQKGADHP